MKTSRKLHAEHVEKCHHLASTMEEQHTNAAEHLGKLFGVVSKTEGADDEAVKCAESYVKCHDEMAKGWGAFKDHCANQMAEKAEGDNDIEKAAGTVDLEEKVQVLGEVVEKFLSTVKPAEINRVVPDVPVFAVTRQGSRGIETNVDPHWANAMGLNE
jgi:hypothetical protein